MPRNTYSPTYSPYADAALISRTGIDLTFPTPREAIAFQKGFSSWRAKQTGYEGLRTATIGPITIRILNAASLHTSVEVTDAVTGAPVTIGLDADHAVREMGLDDLGPATFPTLPEEGLDL